MLKMAVSEPSDEVRQRVIRLMSDAKNLRGTLTDAEARAVYTHLEAARDAISAILDRADEKDA